MALVLAPLVWYLTDPLIDKEWFSTLVIPAKIIRSNLVGGANVSVSIFCALDVLLHSGC